MKNVTNSLEHVWQWTIEFPNAPWDFNGAIDRWECKRCGIVRHTRNSIVSGCAPKAETKAIATYEA
jgi:hypothetical protein